MYQLNRIDNGEKKYTIQMGEHKLGITELIDGKWYSKIEGYNHTASSRKKSVEGCIKKIIHAGLSIDK